MLGCGNLLCVSALELSVNVCAYCLRGSRTKKHPVRAPFFFVVVRHLGRAIRLSSAIFEFDASRRSRGVVKMRPHGDKSRCSPLVAISNERSMSKSAHEKCSILNHCTTEGCKTVIFSCQTPPYCL